MLQVDRKLCDLCGTCVAVCPMDCIELNEFMIQIDQELCTSCMRCIQICPFAALSLSETETLS
jgi:ferredoxin